MFYLMRHLKNARCSLVKLRAAILNKEDIFIIHENTKVIENIKKGAFMPRPI